MNCFTTFEHCKFGKDLNLAIWWVVWGCQICRHSYTLSCNLWHCTSTWRRSNLKRNIRVVKTLDLYPGRTPIWQAGVCAQHTRRICNSCMSVCMGPLYWPSAVWYDAFDVRGHPKCSISKTVTNGNIQWTLYDFIVHFGNYSSDRIIALQNIKFAKC